MSSARHQWHRVVKSLTFLVTMALLVGCSTASWREASRESANIAPSPDAYRDAVLQVYAADAWGWRGWFAVHTWISVKPSGADQYTVLEVIGWRAKRGLPVLRVEQDVPDRFWFGSEPELVLDLRGEQVDALIDKVMLAAKQYPWANEYEVFPGPNSNTFPAWIAQQVPDLHLQLPWRAIGSGWID